METPFNPEQEARVKRNRRFGRALFAGSLVVAMGVALGATYALARYDNTLLPNTIVGDVFVGGLPVETAKKVVAEAVLADPNITVELGNQPLTVAKKDLGVDYQIDEALRQAFVAGHSGSIINRLADTGRSAFTANRISIKVLVDDDKVMAWVDSNIANLVKEPVNATLEVKKNAVVINPSADGLALDVEKVANDMVAAAERIPTVVVKVTPRVVPPAVTAESLKTYQATLEADAKIPVVLNVNNQPVSPTFAQQITWFTVPSQAGGNEAAPITLNSAAVARTVNAIAAKVNVKMVKEQVNPEGQLLMAGRDGLTMDEQAAVKGIVDQMGALLAQSSMPAGAAVNVAVPTTVVPKEQVVTTSIQVASVNATETVVPAIDTDAKFIQISLAKQRMYVFENHQLINIFAISSGKAGYETPKGVHQIYSKALRPLSRKYGLYMPYWNAITPDGGYGIHDLPEWPSGKKETDAHLGTPVSHGCIRLNSQAAQYIYNWAPIGTAVVVQ